MALNDLLKKREEDFGSMSARDRERAAAAKLPVISSKGTLSAKEILQADAKPTSALSAKNSERLGAAVAESKKVDYIPTIGMTGSEMRDKGIIEPTTKLSITDIFKPKTTGMTGSEMRDKGVIGSGKFDIIDAYNTAASARADAAVAKPDEAKAGWLKGAGQQTTAGFVNVLPTLAEMVRDVTAASREKANERRKNEETPKPLSPISTGDAEMDAYLEGISGDATRATERATEIAPKETGLEGWQKYADELAANAQMEIEKSKQGKGKVEQTLIDIGVAGAQLVGDVLVATATGGSSMPVMAVRSFGSAAQEARLNGASAMEQTLYGFANAAVEVLTEKIFGGPRLMQKAYGKGLLDDVVSGLGKKIASESGAVVWLATKSFLEEGAEEFIASVINPVISSIYNENALAEAYGSGAAVKETLINALYDGLVGGILGFAGFSVNVNSEVGKFRQELAMTKLSEVVSLEKLGKEMGGEAEVMIKALAQFRDYADGTATRTLGRDLYEALYERINAGDTKGVRSFFTENRELFDKLIKHMALEQDKIIPKEENPYRNGTLGRIATENIGKANEAAEIAAEQEVNIMSEPQTIVFNALVKNGMSTREAAEAYEAVARIVEGDEALSNNEIIKAGVSKDKRIRAAINELMGATLDTSKNEMSASAAKQQVREIINTIAAKKAAETQAAAEQMQQVAYQQQAEADVAEMVQAATEQAAAPEMQSGAAKFISFAQNGVQSENKAQRETVEYADDEIRIAAERAGISESEARALLNTYGAYARAVGIDPVSDPEAFVKFSKEAKASGAVKPGEISMEQQLTADILKVALADLGIKDVRLVTADPDMLGTNGSFYNGVITINADKVNTQTYSGMAWVVGHEIVHAAETAAGNLKNEAGETTGNAPIVEDIFSLMRSLADAGVVTGTYAEAARNEATMNELIALKKSVQPEFNDFDAKAEIAADFLGAMLGHNTLHEATGRFGSKYGTVDLLTIIGKENSGLLRKARNFVADMRAKFAAQTPAEARAAKAKAIMQRQLTRLGNNLTEAIQKGVKENATQESGVKKSADGFEVRGYNPNLRYMTWKAQADLVRRNKFGEFVSGDWSKSGDAARQSVMYVLDKPTKLLEDIGLSDLPFVITQKHFLDAQKQRWDSKGNIINPKAHQISEKIIDELPELIKNPVAVFKSDPNGPSRGGIVILTDKVDGHQNPITITVNTDQPYYVYDGENGPAHFVNIYGRENSAAYFKAVLDFNSLLYVNKRKANSVPALRAEINRHSSQYGISFDTVIQQKDPSVNANLPQRKFSRDDGVYAAPMYSKLQREIEAFKGDKIGASSAISYLRGKGVKAEEIKWSGIETYLEGKKSVNKQELLDWLKQNELTLTTTIRGGKNEEFILDQPAMNPLTGEIILNWGDFENQAYEAAETMGYDWENDVHFDRYGGTWEAYIVDPQTREVVDIMSIDPEEYRNPETSWEDYTVGAALDYREILWKMPNADYSNHAMDVHWEDSGVVVHARVDTQDLSDGRSVLFIEEIQSDWHNAGAQMGYATKGAVEKAEEQAGLTEARKAEMYRQLLWDLEDFYRDYGVDTPRLAAEQHLDMFYDNTLVEAYNSFFNFPADLKTRLDKYFEFDKQVDEFHKQAIRAARAVPDAPYAKTYHEYALKNLLRMAAEEGYDVLGWTTAQMQENRWSSEYAEGYRIEYDQDIPKFLNKYGKQWGVKVEKAHLGSSMGNSDIERELQDLEAEKASWEAELDRAIDEGRLESMEFISSQIEYYEKDIKKLKTNNEIWVLPITPEMRDSVLYEGQPKYSKDDTLDKTTESDYSEISNPEEDGNGREENSDNRGRQDSGRTDSKLSDRQSNSEIHESGRSLGRGDLGVHVGELISPKTRKIMDDKGIPNVELGETTDRGAFSIALDAAKAANPNGGMVDSQSAESLEAHNARTFMRSDGMSGVAVEGDGNIVGVFKNPEYKQRGAVKDLVLTALANGGNHLDCYATYSKSDLRNMYAALGFNPVCYLEFSREYAPEGWNYEAWGEPDVVLWVHNGDNVERIVERAESYRIPTREEIHTLPKFDDYDQAKDYQRQKVQEMLRKRDRIAALEQVFRNARSTYGENFSQADSDLETNAGRERLNRVFRPATKQAKAEQRSADELRLARERVREAERREAMRDAFRLEKQAMREEARAEKMAALIVQKETLDEKWKERMDKKVEALKEQAATRLRIQKYRSAFQRDYENLAARMRDKRARAKAERKVAEANRAASERAAEVRVNSRKAAKEARSILNKSRNTDRPDYTNDDVEILRQLPENEPSTSKIAEKAQKLRTAAKRAYSIIVNQAQAIDNFSKLQLSGMRAGDLVNMVFSSASTIETIYQNGLVARDGTRLGDAMKEVMLMTNEDGSIDKEKQELLQKYLLLMHNTDRMSFTARALERVEAIEDAHPWLVEMGVKEFGYAAALNDSETEATGTEERRAIVREYAAALKALNEAKDKPVVGDVNGKPVSAETSDRMASELAAEHDWLEAKANAIYEWWDAFMREWAVGSTLSADEYATWKQLYPHYVPTYRVGADGAEAAVQIGGVKAQIMDIFKGATGSIKPVKNFEESFSMLVWKIVDTTRKNELFRNVIDTAMLDGEGVFTDFAIFDWQGFYEAYAENFMDSSEWYLGDSYEQAEASFKTAIEELDGGYRITAYNENGERFSAYLSKEMYRSLAAVTEKSKLLGEGVQTLTRIGGKLTNPMKAMITGYNPMFAIRNIMRDVPSAVVNGISGLAFPKYFGQAMVQMKNGSEAWEQFKALGGTHYGYYGETAEWAKRMAEKPGLVNKAKAGLGKINEVTESVTRFAEYLATIDKLGDSYETRVRAIKNAAEITVDFSRKGEYGALANAWIPYFNPAVQGIDKVIRQTFKGDTAKEKFKQAGVTLTRASVIAVLPELLQYLLLKAFDRYDDWEEVSDRMRDTYFLIPLPGEHKFLKIPKTREWGTILGTPLMRILEGVEGRSDPFNNYVEDALLANFTVNGVEEIVGIGTLLNLRENKDFAGRDIVPYAYQDASKSMQYDSDTTAIAFSAAFAYNKTIAKLAENLGMDIELSPMQLDYILNDYCGDFVYMLAEMAPIGLFDGSMSLGDVFDSVLGSLEGSWVGDNRYSNFYVAEYYDALDYLERGIADEKLMNPEDYKESYIYKLDKAFAEAYGDKMSELNKAYGMNYGSEIKRLRKKANEAKTLAEKEQYLKQIADLEQKNTPEFRDAVKEQIAELAIEASAWFRNELLNNSDDPFLRVSYGSFSIELQDALIDLDSYSKDYHFKPSPSTTKKYTDPYNSGKEYVLTDEQYAQYKEFYADAYNDVMSKAVKSSTYRRAKGEERAEYLDEARDEVHGIAKEELFKWLQKQGVKSTPKKD